MSYKTLELIEHERVSLIKLNRPEVLNAFNEELYIIS